MWRFLVNKMKRKIKIERVSTWSIITTIIVAILFGFISFQSEKEFHVLQTTTEQYILCEKAAKQLQDGSDYLTEQVRLYVMTTEREYLDLYFEEADETQRREKALTDLKQYFSDTETFDSLESALQCSQELMNTEYYSMRLVLEATEEQEIPDKLKTIELTQEDKQLSNEEKIKNSGAEIIEESEIEEKITITEAYLSTDEVIFTDVDTLTKYLLFGSLDKDEEYTVKPGDTIETVAFNNKLGVEEFLIVNPEFTSSNNLLSVGQKVSIALIDPIFSIVVEKHIVEDMDKPFNTVEKEDSSIYSGQTKVQTEGVVGTQRVTEKIKYVNGEAQPAVITNVTTIKEPIDKVVLKGTKSYGSNYTGGGTPAVTTRGADEADMDTIAEAIKAAVLDHDKERAEALVKSIVEKYPLYA